MKYVDSAFQGQEALNEAYRLMQEETEVMVWASSVPTRDAVTFAHRHHWEYTFSDFYHAYGFKRKDK
jgi:ubiquinone/menaquinone biosynthesis C-methylase UbiE